MNDPRASVASSSWQAAGGGGELEQVALALRGVATPKVEGRVENAAGLVIEAALPGASIGDICELGPRGSKRLAEVVGIRGALSLLVPLGGQTGLRAGMPVRRIREQTVSVGRELLGRVIDAMGEPIDGKGPIAYSSHRPLHSDPPSPMLRGAVKDPMPTGIRAVDSFLLMSRGMRMGIFAAAGVGKSTFVGAVLRNTRASINVIALVGERGREVSEFVQHILGEDGMARSVLVVATSDRSPMERVRAAFAATAIAEHFRDEGGDVLLVLDSLTRLGMAQREIGLAAGEPSTAKGYTPSVFTLMPRLLERVCPTRNGGSITGLYTVLVEGDDINEPLADSARSLLDGHIVLSRDLASRGHYPAIDVLGSISRTMDATASKEQRAQAHALREQLAVAKEAQELMNFGAYVPGRNARFDKALEKQNELNAFLKQDQLEATAFPETLSRLTTLSLVAKRGGQS